MCGAMEHRWTSITGQTNNQTTFKMRIVFILSVSFKIISTHGAMLTAVAATGSLVRKVQYIRVPDFDGLHNFFLSRASLEGQ